MEKLRVNKLQVIIASCELELCLVSMDDHSEGSKKRARRPRGEEKAAELIHNHQLFTLSLSNLGQEEMEKLSIEFQEIIQSWQFIDIGEDEELP